MDKIVVLDFGGQYTHLIASKIRGLGVYAEIANPSDFVKAKGYIFSGGPHSVYEKGAPKPNPKYYKQRVPILGLCYGHQLICQKFGGNIMPGEVKEFGKAILEVKSRKFIFQGLRDEERVWMSHGDNVQALPDGFKILGSTSQCPISAVAHPGKRIFGLQFHPEVNHTPCGMKILENFVDLCQCERNWTVSNFIENSLQEIKKRAKGKKVLVLMSGGVDSAVAAILLSQALGPERVLGLHIDNGLERKNEIEEIKNTFCQLGFNNFHIRDASVLFLEKLKQVADPEKKRDIVGGLFIRVLNEEIAALSLNPKEWLVAQGTIYPDTIETARTQHADLIKTHHNRVRAAQELIKRGALIEPLEHLYKDEVREVGLELGLPEKVIGRHPFPGPGLAVRVICSDMTWGADQYSEGIIQAEKEIQDICQKFNFDAWILPVKTVGVQGDQRSYSQPVVLKGRNEWEVLEKISTEITNRFGEIINRVWYLASPPYISLKHLALWQKYLTPERIKLLQTADYLTTDTVKKAGLLGKIWQMPVVLLPLSFTYRTESILLRPVLSENAMTAEWARLPWKTVRKITGKLLGLEEIGLVFYDLTHKPPGTIELE